MKTRVFRLDERLKKAKGAARNEVKSFLLVERRITTTTARTHRFAATTRRAKLIAQAASSLSQQQRRDPSEWSRDKRELQCRSVEPRRAGARACVSYGHIFPHTAATTARDQFSHI